MARKKKKTIDYVLHEIYYDVANPGGFSSAEKLRNAAIALGHDYSLNDVRKWLAGEEVYTVSRRSTSKHTADRGIQSAGLDSKWESDLAVLLQFSADNDGYSYIMFAIDVFSRHLWARALRTKRAEEVAKALESVFLSGNRPEHVLLSDKGSEYTGAPTQRLLKRYKINHVIALDNQFHCAHVERVCKTIKDRLYKFFLHTNSHRWIDVLDKIVDAYNNTVHSSIGFAPAQVTVDNQPLVRFRQYRIKHPLSKSKCPPDKNSLNGDDNENPPPSGFVVKSEPSKPLTTDGQAVSAASADTTSQQKTNTRKTYTKRVIKPKFKVGDQVRVAKVKGVFFRSYDIKFTSEIFTVVKVMMRESQPVYKLNDLANEPLAGFFYQHELTLVIPDPNQEYKIDEILKVRPKTKTRPKQALVSWLHWPRKFASWVTFSSIKDISSQSNNNTAPKKESQNNKNSGKRKSRRKKY